jgi:hypothetical protein
MIIAPITFPQGAFTTKLGFTARRTVEDAIVDLKSAFAAGKVPNSMTDECYYNIKRMQMLNLQ